MKETGWYLSNFKKYFNVRIISPQKISGRNSLETSEITFFDLRGNMFEFFSISVDCDVFWTTKVL